MSKKSGNFLNPYDTGVRKAIALSRESLAPTVEQTHASLNDALATFGAMLAQMKPGSQKGLFNNLAAIAPAGFPAVQAYNKAQREAREQNKILANEHQNYAREEAQQAAKAQEYATEQEWKQRDFDLRKFQAGEQARHNLAQETKPSQYQIDKEADQKNTDRLNHILDQAEQKILKGINQGENQEQGFIKGFANKVSPLDLRSEEQSEIDALGFLIKDEIAKKYNINTDARAKEIEKISSKNSPENNLAYIRQVRAALNASHNSSQQVQMPHYSSNAPKNIVSQNNITQPSSQQSQSSIKMLDPETGDIQEVEPHLVKDAEILGLVQVK